MEALHLPGGLARGSGVLQWEQARGETHGVPQRRGRGSHPLQCHPPLPLPQCLRHQGPHLSVQLGLQLRLELRLKVAGGGGGEGVGVLEEETSHGFEGAAGPGARAHRARGGKRLGWP